MQSKAESMIEISVNVGIKFITATGIWILLRPYALDLPAAIVTSIFTANSFILGYAIRRYFEKQEEA